MLTLGDRGDAVAAMQEELGKYGYGIAISGTYDSVTQAVVTAFQRHFRPERVDGIGDESTRATLRELLAQSGRAQTIAAPRSQPRSPRRLLTAKAKLPIPLSVSRSDGRFGETERLPGRKVRAPWTSGAG